MTAGERDEKSDVRVLNRIAKTGGASPERSGRRPKFESRPQQSVELISESLYAVGGMVELDGRISWVPQSARGYQPNNAYLLVEGSRALLVDTGLPVHRASVLAQLGEILPMDADFCVYITRAESDTVGNLGPITHTYKVRTTYTGGTSNPFDAFDEVASVLDRRPPGYRIDLSDERHLETLNAPLKMITQFWAYDTGTKTLFTSDSFGHHVLSSSSYSVRPTSADDARSLSRLEEFSMCRYWWLQHIDDPSELVSALDAAFNERDVERIAPTHGCVVEGREAVMKQYMALRALLMVRRNDARAGGP